MSKDEHQKPKHHAHKTHNKVFDVTRPGRAPASPNSRSVVPSSKPPVADDQFVPSAPVLLASDPNTKHDLLNAKNRKGIQPLSAPAVVSESESASVLPANQITDSAESAVSSIETQTPSAPEVTNQPTVSEPVPTTEATSDESLATSLLTDQTPTAPLAPEEDTPAHIVMEQTVETVADASPETPEQNPSIPSGPAKAKVPIWEHPDTSEQVEGSQTPASQSPRSAKTIEDLLAETGAPTLEPEHTPSLIVSHHSHRKAAWWEPVLIFLLIVVVAAVALNFLLDADIIKTSLNIPHTDLF
jgi:hypothetical protein